jgi:membrane-associated phospholipid phosphatase
MTLKELEVKNIKSRFFKTERSLFIAFVVTLVGFLFVTFFRADFRSVDSGINLFIPSIQSIPITFFAQGIALIFDTISLVIISLIISGVLFLKNYKAQSLLLMGAMGGDALIVSALKTLEHVARPTNQILSDTGFSYPSGHSAGCIIFGGLLAYFAWRHWQSRGSRFVIGMGLGMEIGLVGFDRVYLNVHWLSDVFGGWLFGACWLFFVILVFRQLNLAGRFHSDRLNKVTDVLFALAVVTAVLIVLLELLGFSLVF